jgi:hypothetical protein
MIDAAKYVLVLTFPTPFVNPLLQINEMATATQMMQHNVGLEERPHKCLETLLRAETEADELISDVLSVMVKHDAKGAKLKAEAAVLRAARGEKQSLHSNRT